MTGITPAGLTAAPAAPGSADQKTGKAAKDFEALLIGQMLKAARDEKSGWLGSEDGDESSDAVLSLGEQQIAQALSNGGGLGLARMIQSHLSATPPPPSGTDH